MSHHGGGPLGGVGAAGGGAVGGISGGTVRFEGTMSSTVDATSNSLIASPGAMGGLNSSGQLASGSHGVFGLQGLDVTSGTSASGETLIRSSRHDVHLDRGTRMLLRSNAAATANTNTSALG